MSETGLEILPHASGWIFKLRGIESAPYPTQQLALRAGKTAAFLSAEAANSYPQTMFANAHLAQSPSRRLDKAV